MYFLYYQLLHIFNQWLIKVRWNVLNELFTSLWNRAWIEWSNIFSSFENQLFKFLGKVAVQIEQEKEMGLGEIHRVET